MSKSVILIGEPLGLLIAQSEGALENVSGYSLAVAGAEFNVAVGLARLDHKVTYFTKLGNDPFGKLVTNVINKNQIGTEFIQYSEERTTGFMLKSMVSSGDPEIFYYRKNSAASTLSTADIDQIDLSGHRFLHLTGILPALSTSTREAVFYLIEKARKHDLFISFDPNLRPQLWESKEYMISTINKLASMSDIVFPGENEGEILCGSKDPQKISEFYHNLGVKAVVTKLGSNGAFVSDENGEVLIPGFPVKKVIDTVGAGDGFAAGVISALMEELPLSDAVLRGNAIGAIQVMSRGDNDGLPSREALIRFMKEGVL
jgi:2-dehydro-3-deoxygluconokinase